jgi:predicted nucleotidyltransferase
MDFKKFGLKDSDGVELLRILSEFTNLKTVFLFGSRAIGNFKKTSDVDLAVEFSTESRTHSRELAAKLNDHSRMPYKFDVLSLPDLTDKNVREHIDKYGIKIF